MTHLNVYVYVVDICFQFLSTVIRGFTITNHNHDHIYSKGCKYANAKMVNENVLFKCCKNCIVT